MEVVVLGSGGAKPDPRRGPSAYLVRVASRRLLVDAAAVALDRLTGLGESARDLSVVALTHGHLDHAGGLATVLFGAWMDGREEPMAVAGPAGRGGQPGIDEICDRLFGPQGAWRYLRDLPGFGVDLRVGPEPGRIATVWDEPGLTMRATPVRHGRMPAVAYRIDGDGRSVCFSGDISGEDDALVELAEGVDVLVHDQAIAHRTADPKGNHPLPEDTADNAARAGARHLVLSHLTADAVDNLDEVVERVRARFGGPVTVAHDGLRLFGD